MKILSLNSGSSSIKFKLFEMKKLKLLASGLIEQIKEPEAHIKADFYEKNNQISIEKKLYIPNHKKGFEIINQIISESKSISKLNELDAIGHRVVHGGEVFHKPTLIDKKVTKAIAKLTPLAPLHNPANLEGIRISLKKAPDVPQVAVFDTAFHQSIPKHAYMYALPYEFYERSKVRRYGFHGTSHYFVAKQVANHLKIPLSRLNMITIHLGSGSSICAVKNGKSIDTSMGMTPLEGLVMGTRSGDIDPAIIFYLSKECDLNMKEIDLILNQKSGLKGICGINDMREILQRSKEDDRAKLAVDIFCYRIKKYIGAYSAILGKVDCIVFTGGIGEHSSHIREKICKGLKDSLNIVMNPSKNKRFKEGVGEISSKKSKIKIICASTDEELEIAIQAREIVEKD